MNIGLLIVLGLFNLGRIQMILRGYVSSLYNILYIRPVRTKKNFAILKTFTSVTIMYAMMNKFLKF